MGSAPSTVSMWPRKRTVGWPSAMDAISFPAASERPARPRSRERSKKRGTAPPSSPEGLYASRSARRTSTSSMMQDPPERVEGEGPLVLGDHERRQEPNNTRPSADREDALLLQSLQDRRRLSAQLDSDHQAEAPDFADGREVESAQRLDSFVSESFRPFPKAFLHRVFDRRGSRGAGERVAAKGGIVAPMEGVLHLLGREGRADRDAAREGLGHGQEIRFHAPSLDGEQPARSSHARLHFVEDEQGARAVARLAGRRQVFRGRDVHTALALDRFEDHRGGVSVDRLL